MKRLLVVSAALALLPGLLSCGQQQEPVVEDIVTAHPAHAAVVFENDYVKAVEFTLKPGEELPLHKGGPRVVYSLSDYTIEWTEGAQVTTKSWSQGDAHWHDAIDHAVKNTGTSEARYLVVTRKATALPAAGDIDVSEDAGQVDTAHASVVMENDHGRVVEVHLLAGEKQPTHQGGYRLIYSLTPYEISYTSGEEEATMSTMAAGDAHWHAPDTHAVENVGESPAHYVIFTFKH
jgi:hypothetical protein